MRMFKRVLANLTVLRAAALVFVVLLIVAALLAPVIAPYDPIQQNIPNKLKAPGFEGHILGTDEFGRDVFSRLLFGARAELYIALGSTVFAAVAGTVIGMVGGFMNRFVEMVTMRSMDVVMSFPPVILALLIVTIYGPGEGTLIVVMGIVFTPAFARLAYGQTLSVRRSEYVEAAEVFGAPLRTLLFGVVLRNIAAPIIVQFSVTLAGSILLGSGLSYLGLGVLPPAASWGSMVATGQRFMASQPEMLIVPGIAVALTILAFGVVGDLLRDSFDPRTTRRAR